MWADASSAEYLPWYSGVDIVPPVWEDNATMVGKEIDFKEDVFIDPDLLISVKTLSTSRQEELRWIISGAINSGWVSWEPRVLNWIVEWFLETL